MLTSKERADLRAQANTLDTTLIVGKEGVTQAVAEEADTQLTARELIKGRVLEGSLMTAREACDALCEATGADGVACIGSKFVIYRFSEKCQAQRNETGQAEGHPCQQSRPRAQGRPGTAAGHEAAAGAAQRLFPPAGH